MKIVRLESSALALGLTLALGAHADVAPPPQENTQEFNKEVVHEAISLLGDGQIDEAIDTYWSEAYVQHNPSLETGREALRAFFKASRAANPQSSLEVKRLFAEGDLVVVHIHAKNSPEDRGSAIVDIVRVKDGKLVEHWDVIQPVPETSLNDNTMF